MSISRFKNSQDLNKIGLELSEGKNVKWLPSDFKKNGGYEKSLSIVREYKMYFQHYCGCKFSIRANKEEL
jgi:predicted adenine nucleotide alpha hydrolase (AANH) superfamily ATPase